MDIVKRLRHTEKHAATIGKGLVYLQVPVNPDGPEAANEIERLREDRERLRDALFLTLPYVKKDEEVEAVVHSALMEE